MIKMNHSLHGHHHWVTVAVVLIALLLTLTEVHGQAAPTLGAGAMFQGRPEMAGAQGGMGAQGGLPQGGIGVQGSENAQRSLNLRKPSGLDDMGKPAPLVASADAKANMDGTLLVKEDGIVKKSDDAIAKDERSAVKKTKRAVKRTAQRKRHGVSTIDAVK